MLNLAVGERGRERVVWDEVGESPRGEPGFHARWDGRYWSFRAKGHSGLTADWVRTPGWCVDTRLEWAGRERGEETSQDVSDLVRESGDLHVHWVRVTHSGEKWSGWMLDIFWTWILWGATSSQGQKDPGPFLGWRGGRAGNTTCLILLTLSKTLQPQQPWFRAL